MKDLTPNQIRFGINDGGRWIELGLRHNCWKHEDDLTIRYEGVRSTTPDLFDHELDWAQLGSVILDEILPDRDGCSHEIVCRYLSTTWFDAVCSEKPPPR